MFFADRFFGFDDAIYASLRLLEIVASAKAPLHELWPMCPSLATPELRVDCSITQVRPGRARTCTAEQPTKSSTSTARVSSSTGVGAWCGPRTHSRCWSSASKQEPHAAGRVARKSRPRWSVSKQ